jgi:hypothetical protein
MVEPSEDETVLINVVRIRVINYLSRPITGFAEPNDKLRTPECRRESSQIDLILSF